MKRFFLACLFLASPLFADPTLHDRLYSDDVAISSAAYADVEKLSSTDRKLLVVSLQEALRRDAVSARGAARALVHCGSEAESAVPDLMDALRYDESDVATAAGDALIKIGSASIRPLIKALDDPNFILRQRAATILGGLGPSARPAAGSLVDLLEDTQPQVQTAAEESLIKIGELALTPLDIALRKTPNPQSRKSIAVMLARFGPPAAPVLAHALANDPSASVRTSAATSLSTLHPVPPAAAPALIAALRDGDENVRRTAVVGLSGLGPDAAAAIGPLIVIVHQDTEALVKERASQALEGIGHASKASLPGISENLKNKDAEIRRQSIAALSDIDFASVDVTAPLSFAIKDESPAVRGAAVRVLGAMAKTSAGPAVTQLRVALADPDKSVRSAAIEAIGNATQSAEDAAIALESVLSDPDPGVRNEIIKSLASLGPPAIPVLLRELGDAYSVLSDKAEEAIVRMGPDAIPVLQKASPSDPVLQKRAAELITRIQEPPRPVKKSKPQRAK